MTPTLHLAPGTIAMSVHATLEEAGMKHNLAWVDFSTGAQTQAKYLAVNAKGRVPALEVDGAILTEAIAIIEWIDAKTNAGLIPADPWQAARVREAMCYLSSTVHVAHAHRMRGHRWADAEDAQVAMRTKVTANMAECAAYLEGRMDGDWVAEGVSAADLYLWTITRWFAGDGVALADYPKLAAHASRVAARPAVTRVIALHDARVAGL